MAGEEEIDWYVVSKYLDWLKEQGDVDIGTYSELSVLLHAALGSNRERAGIRRTLELVPNKFVVWRTRNKLQGKQW